MKRLSTGRWLFVVIQASRKVGERFRPFRNTQEPPDGDETEWKNSFNLWKISQPGGRVMDMAHIRVPETGIEPV